MSIRIVAVIGFLFVAACAQEEADTDYSAPAFDEAAARADIEALAQNLSDSWNAKSGEAFAKDFSDDAVFTVWFGYQMTGPQDIAFGHQMIFDGIYAETDALFAPDKIRFLGDDAAVVHMRGYLYPAGGAATMDEPSFAPMLVAARGAEGWRIEAFQNTRIDLSNMTGGKDIREQ